MSERILTPEEVEIRAKRRAGCYCDFCVETMVLIATIRAAWAERDAYLLRCNAAEACQLVAVDNADFAKARYECAEAERDAALAEVERLRAVVYIARTLEQNRHDPSAVMPWKRLQYALAALGKESKP